MYSRMAVTQQHQSLHLSACGAVLNQKASVTTWLTRADLNAYEYIINNFD